MAPRIRMLIVATAALAVLAFGAAPAHAATITVTDQADSFNPDGCSTGPTCSLREAIELADDDQGSTVIIPAGNYLLNTTDPILGDIEVSSSMTIRGAGADVTTVDGNQSSRIFNVDDYETVTISGLTLTGGVTPAVDGDEDASGDGGAILTSAEFLTLSDVSIVGNRASFSGGGVSSYVEFGLFEVGTLNLVRSTVANNRVEGTGNGQGGGVLSAGILNMTNSTVAGNSIETAGASQGGGVTAGAFDVLIEGQPETVTGTTTLVNSTIAGNSITGAASALGLGGGFSGDDLGSGPLDSELIATNSIIAGNTIGGAEDNCALTDTTGTANNISGDSSCGFGDAGSRQDTNPLLGALADNGGPTPTLKPQPGSPALDTAAAGGCPSGDQRGVVRPVGAGCDIGAVELAPPTAVTGVANGLTGSGATLTGAAGNPLVAPGVAAFQYGTSTSYGSVVNVGEVPPGSVSAPQAAAVTGLRPNTLYHYRLIVANGDGVAIGADRTFRTRQLARPTGRLLGVPSRCTAKAFTLSVRARAASGTRVRAVRVTLDGRVVKRSSKGRFKVRIRAAQLTSGRHVLAVRVTDRRGRSRVITRSFRRCARPDQVRVPNFTG